MLTDLAALVTDVSAALDEYRIRSRPRSHRSVLLELLRPLPRAGEVSSLRRPRRSRRGLREPRDAGGALRDAAALRAVLAVCHGRSVVVVARGFHSPAAVAGASGPCRPHAARCLGVSMSARRDSGSGGSAPGEIRSRNGPSRRRLRERSCAIRRSGSRRWSPRASILAPLSARRTSPRSSSNRASRLRYRSSSLKPEPALSEPAS